MKFFLILFLGAIFSFVSVQVFNLYADRNALKDSLGASALEAAKLSSENEQYQKTIEFNKNDQNLIKEAQTKYNVQRSGEEMYILIPPKSATGT